MFISGLYIYPIKSCGGIALNRKASIATYGFYGDRCYVLADNEGNFLSQRSLPRMATITPQITDHYLDARNLLLTAPGMESLTISQDSFTEEKGNVVVWDDTCSGTVADAETNMWFSDFLGVNCRLIRYDEATPRLRESSTLGITYPIMFADAYPVLVISEASLAELNRRIVSAGGDPVPMERFRPNIVISGCNAHDEDTWDILRVEKSTPILKYAKKCIRCAITTTDQKTGMVAGQEPLKTLSSYRREDKGVSFGSNYLVSVGGVIYLDERIKTETRV